MKFSKAVAVLAAAVPAYAKNTITFISQDVLDRTIYFTSNPKSPHIEPVRIEGHTNKTVHIPWGWVGNYYAVVDGKENVPGMLGEFAFNGWGGNTFFDVSAIVNPTDGDGVKKIWPVDDLEPFSGCDLFPCNFAYYLPDDVQTKASTKTDFYCTLGNPGSNPGRGHLGDSADSPDLVERSFSVIEPVDNSPSYSRDFVTGKRYW